MVRFCVRCGAEEREDFPIIDGLCPKCFIKERKIVDLPSKIEVTICPSCGSTLLKGKWVYISDSIEETVETVINDVFIKRANTYPGFEKVSIRVKELRETTARLIITGFYKGAPVSQEVLINVLIKRRLCPRCMKIKSGHFEAELQIRTMAPLRGRWSKRFVSDVQNMKRLQESVVDVKEVKNGVDVKVLDQKTAMKLANYLKKVFGAKVVTTWKDAGYKSGRKHSKLTISIRLPGLIEGDVINLGNRLAIVTAFYGSKMIVRFLDTGEEATVSLQKAWSEGLRYLTKKEYTFKENEFHILVVSLGGVVYIFLSNKLKIHL
jgi:nonsense-mediated mRNA decay protein 3